MQHIKFTFLIWWSQNLFHLFCKSHVQHLIDFIQNHMFQLREVQFIILKVVFDATGGADQDVDSTADRINYTESKEDVRACQMSVSCSLKLQCRIRNCLIEWTRRGAYF